MWDAEEWVLPKRAIGEIMSFKKVRPYLGYSVNVKYCVPCIVWLRRRIKEVEHEKSEIINHGAELQRTK